MSQHPSAETIKRRSHSRLPLLPPHFGVSAKPLWLAISGGYSAEHPRSSSHSHAPAARRSQAGLQGMPVLQEVGCERGACEQALVVGLGRVPSPRWAFCFGLFFWKSGSRRSSVLGVNADEPRSL